MSRTSWSHLLPMVASKLIKPVALPPGRARLCTKPVPIGSDTATKMTGTLGVVCRISVIAGVIKVTISSGPRASNSCASARRPARSPAARTSMRTFWPSIQPSAPSPPLSAREIGGGPRIVGVEPHQHADPPHPLTCCARAASGHCRRAAEKRDELAPPHALPSSRGSHPTTSLKKPCCASQHFGPPDFRNGS